MGINPAKMKKDKPIKPAHCINMLRGISDTQDLLSGKWKIIIIGLLYYGGTMRFMDLKRAVEGIAPKMLSKELKDLEMNQLITRTTRDTRPISVEYSLTDQGKSLNTVLDAMGSWGVRYRHQVVTDAI